MMQKYFYLLLSVLFIACGQGKSKQEQKQPTETPQTTVEMPQFSADSAYQYIQQQVDFGARVPNTEAHRRCAIYLSESLKRFGGEVAVQAVQLKAYDGTLLNAQNIIGSFNPSAERRVLLFAHWDTRPWADHDSDASKQKEPILGANDGASGVGILLEMARLFGENPPPIGIDITFFDAEDYGVPAFSDAKDDKSWCLGSQYWAATPHRPGYRAKYGILLDMVGAPNAQFFREQVSDYYAKSIVSKVWRKAAQLGFDHYFINEKGGAVTDDHLYINEIASIPSIDIIQHNPHSPSGFGDYWHTHDDTMKNIDKATLNAVGTTLINVLYNE